MQRSALLVAFALGALVLQPGFTEPCRAFQAVEREAPPEKEEKPKTEKVTLAPDHVFELELSATAESRRIGLMKRKKLDAYGGMLFVYPDARMRTMWMANCVIDIDVLFLDRGGRVLRTWAMKAEPPRGEHEDEFDYEDRLRRYSSGRAAQFAVEVPAGTIRKLELRVGQTIALDLVRLKKIAREAEAREREERRKKKREDGG